MAHTYLQKYRIASKHMQRIARFALERAQVPAKCQRAETALKQKTFPTAGLEARHCRHLILHAHQNLLQRSCQRRHQHVHQSFSFSAFFQSSRQ